MTLLPTHEDARRAYEQWLLIGKGVTEDRQSPAEELLAEHYLMRAVLDAMERKAAALAAGQPLHPGFWANVVDFIGNFVHQCHRAKEQEQLFPAALEHGGLVRERSETLAHEHANAKDMTLSLCSAVEESDKDAVLRIVTAYIPFMREHMASEERWLFGPMRDDLPEEQVAPVRAAFDEIEEDRLASGRLHYVEVARELCEQVGIGHELD